MTDPRRVLLAAYILLALLGVWVHEPFSDEADVWVYARDASLADISNYFAFSGHGPLWFLSLLPFAKLGFPMATMQYVNGLFGVMVAWLVLFRSPFSLPFKAALLFTMSIGYQYVAFARGYMLMTLLLFMAAQHYPKRHDRPVRYGMILALLANTEIFALAPAYALAGLFLLERRNSLTRPVWMGAAVFIAGAAVTLAAFWPREGMSRNFDHWHFHPWVIERALAWGFFPQWESLPQSAGAALGATLLALAFMALKSTALRVAFMASMLGFAAIFTFVYQCWLWHYMLVPLCAVALLWTNGWNASLREGTHVQRLAAAGLGIALLAGVVTTAVNYRQDAAEVYGGGRGIAEYLRASGREGEILTSLVCNHTTTVSGYLPETRIWMAGLKRFATYVSWGRELNQCWDMSRKAMLAHAFAKQPNEGRLLVLYFPDWEIPEEFSGQLLYESRGYGYSYALYEVSKK